MDHKSVCQYVEYFRQTLIIFFLLLALNLLQKMGFILLANYIADLHS